MLDHYRPAVRGLAAVWRPPVGRPAVCSYVASRSGWITERSLIGRTFRNRPGQAFGRLAILATGRYNPANRWRTARSSRTFRPMNATAIRRSWRPPPALAPGNRPGNFCSYECRIVTHSAAYWGSEHGAGNGRNRSERSINPIKKAAGRIRRPATFGSRLEPKASR